MKQVIHRLFHERLAPRFGAGVAVERSVEHERR